MTTWYLAYCRPREEGRASLHLRNQGIDSYCPMVEVEKLSRGQRQRPMEPLFPSYLFINVDLDRVPPQRLNATRGLRHIVRFGANWTQIPSSVIYSLMRNEDSDEQRALLSGMPQYGDKVLINDGIFAGLEALYQEPDGDTRSFLLLELLHNSVRHSVDNRAFARM